MLRYYSTVDVVIKEKEDSYQILAVSNALHFFDSPKIAKIGNSNSIKNLDTKR